MTKLEQKLEKVCQKQLEFLLKLEELTYTMPTYYRNIIKDDINDLLENIEEVLEND